MSPKPRRHKPKDLEPDFLFVNSDSRTVAGTSRDPVVHREKQSHVQRRTFALKRRQKEQEEPLRVPEVPNPLRADSNWFPNETDPLELEASFPFDFQNPYLPELLAEQGVASTQTQPQGIEAAPISSLSTSSVILQQTDSVSFVYRPGHFLEDAEQETRIVAGQSLVPGRNHVPSLQFPLRARTVHPMFSGPFHVLESWAPPLIQHFNTILLPEKFFADTLKVPLSQTRHAPAIHAEMQDVMSEPAHLYSFLASASAQMLNREGKLLLPGLNVPDHQVPLFFKTKAIEAIRGLLASGAMNHRLVWDVRCLIANAYFSNAFDDADPHFEAMVSMIQSLGGIHTFGEYFRETTILLDWSAGLKKLAPPRLPVNFDPLRGPPAVASTLDHMNSISGDIGDRLRELCEDMSQPIAEAALQHLEALHLHWWCRKNTVYNPQYYHWLSLRRFAIGYRLLSTPPSTNIEEECFRIALIFWTALTRCPTSGQRCASVQAHTLRARLQNSDLDSLWRDKADLLLWIAIVGALTSRSRIDTEWFASVAVAAAEKTGVDVDNVVEVEAALTHLLYDPILQRAPLKELMMTIERMR